MGMCAPLYLGIYIGTAYIHIRRCVHCTYLVAGIAYVASCGLFDSLKPFICIRLCHVTSNTQVCCYSSDFDSDCDYGVRMCLFVYVPFAHILYLRTTYVAFRNIFHVQVGKIGA